MKSKFTILFLIVCVACKSAKNGTVQQENNYELEQMIKKDQEIRTNDSDEPFEPIDQKHRLRVFEMLVNGELQTATDNENAALLLQHTAATYCNDKLVSVSPENYYLAYCLAKKACGNCYLTAVTLDRYLLFTVGQQKFGTQKEWSEQEQKFLWSPIDSTTSDAERSAYSVPTLQNLLLECEMIEKQ